METITLEHGIPLFYVTASSFPQGIPAAHDKLHALVPFSEERRFFGLSRPEGEKGIVYKAAAEELQAGEGARLNCETMSLKKGRYACITLYNYRQHPERISEVFGQLLHEPQLDPQGYCVEWYFNGTDVRCMVRLQDRT